jgi:hypothetical protein
MLPEYTNCEFQAVEKVVLQQATEPQKAMQGIGVASLVGERCQMRKRFMLYDNTAVRPRQPYPDSDQTCFMQTLVPSFYFLLIFDPLIKDFCI